MCKQYTVDLHHIELLVFNVVLDDQVKLTTVGQSVACSADQILRSFQIQFQCKSQGDGRGLGGLVIGVIADLGEMLLGQQRLFVDFRVLLTGLIDQL